LVPAKVAGFAVVAFRHQVYAVSVALLLGALRYLT